MHACVLTAAVAFAAAGAAGDPFAGAEFPVDNSRFTAMLQWVSANGMPPGGAAGFHVNAGLEEPQHPRGRAQVMLLEAAALEAKDPRAALEVYNRLVGERDVLGIALSAALRRSEVLLRLGRHIAGKDTFERITCRKPSDTTLWLLRDGRWQARPASDVIRPQSRISFLAQEDTRVTCRILCWLAQHTPGSGVGHFLLTLGLLVGVLRGLQLPLFLRAGRTAAKEKPVRRRLLIAGCAVTEIVSLTCVLVRPHDWQFVFALDYLPFAHLGALGDRSVLLGMLAALSFALYVVCLLFPLIQSLFSRMEVGPGPAILISAGVLFFVALLLGGGMPAYAALMWCFALVSGSAVVLAYRLAARRHR
jgi:hypothetical protein